MPSDTPGLADRARFQLDRFLSCNPWVRLLGLFALSFALVESLWWAMTRVAGAGTMGADNGTWVRMVATLATLLGLGLVALLIGLVSATIQQKLDDLREGKSPIIDQGHTLILGSGEKLYAILDELEEANAGHSRAVVAVLSERDKEEIETSLRERLGDLRSIRVEVRQGSPFSVHDLRKVGAGRAGSIVVLAPEPLGAQPSATLGDLATIKTLLALRRIPGALTRNFAVVELVDDTRRAVAQQVGGDGIEILTMSQTLSRLMVQTSRQSGLAQVYRELLSFKGSELYFKSFPQLGGRPFGKAQWHVDGAVVCGVRKQNGGKVLLNPSDELMLEKGDELLVVAENEGSFSLVPAKEPQVPAGFTGASPVARRPDRMLICGSSPKLADMLRELEQTVFPGSEAWLMPGWSKEALGQFIRTEVGTPKSLRFVHVEGDPTMPDELAKIVAVGFGAVMVLADTARGQDEADARTVITVLSLRDLFRQLDSARPRIISEILDPRTKDLLEPEPGADFVVSQEMTSMLLAQISQRRELSVVFAELFDSSAGNELYLKRSACFAPVGQPTPWLVIQKVARQRKEVAIGYLEGGRAPVFNPPKGEMLTFAEGDRVIVIATDDSEAREDLRAVVGLPLPFVSQTKTRSALLPPPVVEEPSAVSAGPRVKGPSNQPRTPLPGKPKG